MLIEFRVENHRSLRDEQVLTMEAGRVGDDSDPRPRHIPGFSDGLLTVAALYGANASGKSNLLNALWFMRDAVLYSHRNWAPLEGVPRNPFAWGPKRAEPSLFEVALLLDGTRYEYGFSTSDKCILEEWLYAWPNSKKQLWFERDQGAFKFGEHLKGENKLIEKVTRPDALFLSAAIQHRHSQLQTIYAWFRTLESRNLRLNVRGRPPRSNNLDELARLVNISPQPTLFSELEQERLVSQLFRKFLTSADLGIVDVKARMRYSIEDPGDRKPQFYLKHRSTSKDAWLPLYEESHGTQVLFRIALPILQAIQYGGVVVIDEFDASLHPSLAREIVQQFNDPATNPKNAQLIFATHDITLLGTTVDESVLRRDQIWLTEKDPEGATVLYPLTDYKPRKVENLERGYLQGRYGAIPFLADFNLLEPASS